MIITGSKVNLASSRCYEQTVTRKSQTVSWGGSNVGVIDQHAYTSFYSNRQQFYASARNGAGDFYLPNRRGINDNDYASAMYTRDGLYTDRTLNTSLAADRTGGNKSNSPASIHRKTVRSILDLIRSLRFGGPFQDSMAIHPFRRTAAPANSTTRQYSASPDAPPALPEKPEGTPENSCVSLSNGLIRSTWSVTQRNSVYLTENECTAFCGEGAAVTADGRTLSFNVEFEMSRSYMEYHELTHICQYTAILTDPLVINLDSNPAQITGQTFFFDLDCDGEKEEISQLSSGSGYLALDKNNDGIINDGSELFGTASGDGFKDLAAYDSDGNGWIDETDDIYHQLRVWTKDENGKDVLLSLKEADVGAIYLDSTDTRFSLTDDENRVNGMVRRTGIYLHEDGSAGSAQQVDF